MVEKLSPEEIDQMASGAQGTQPSVDLGSGIEALDEDLSFRKLAGRTGPVADRVFRAAAVGATLVGLGGCAPEGANASVPEEIPTRTPIETTVKPETPTNIVIETATPKPAVAPAEVHTISPEKLTQERMKRWEGKFWTQKTEKSTGGQETDSYEEEMQIFEKEVTMMVEEGEITASSIDMLIIGNNADIKEKEDGAIEQIAPTKFFGIMISEKEEVTSVTCFTKDASGTEMNLSCDWFDKGKIWGIEYGEYVIKSPEGTALESFFIKEGEEGFRVFKAAPDQFGVLSVREQEVKGELETDENGEWVLTGTVEPKEVKETVTGIIITGENNGETGTFLLECKTLPLDRKLKEGILPETPDLALGRIYLSQERIRYGYLDLKDGTWHGNEGYEDINSILKDYYVETGNPSSTPTLAPTVSPEPTVEQTEPIIKAPEQQINRGRLSINPQAYSLSCELASAEIAVLWYNSVKAGEAINIPPGFDTFEDYFIASVGLADNPISGFCGRVNGWLSTSCDSATGTGYGVYPHPMIKGFQELGIPAEMFVSKNNDTASEELKKILVDSYNNNQVFLFWGRGKNSPAVEFRIHPETEEEYPMALGEHCVAGQVIKIDGEDILIEISDPFPYGSGSRRAWKFETLLWWMRNMGWVMALRVG